MSERFAKPTETEVIACLMEVDGSAPGGAGHLGEERRRAVLDYLENEDEGRALAAEVRSLQAELRRTEDAEIFTLDEQRMQAIRARASASAGGGGPSTGSPQGAVPALIWWGGLALAACLAVAFFLALPTDDHPLVVAQGPEPVGETRPEAPVEEQLRAVAPIEQFEPMGPEPRDEREAYSSRRWAASPPQSSWQGSPAPGSAPPHSSPGRRPAGAFAPPPPDPADLKMVLPERPEMSESTLHGLELRVHWRQIREAAPEDDSAWAPLIASVTGAIEDYESLWGAYRARRTAFDAAGQEAVEAKRQAYDELERTLSESAARGRVWIDYQVALRFPETADELGLEPPDTDPDWPATLRQLREDLDRL